MGEIGYLFNLIFTFPIFNGLMLLYHLFGDFALSIIVLTVVIKLVLFPLTLQQLKSTKAMQALQPQMAEIKKKHGKDQQAQLAATQALYKESGVNPASGCLPLVVQMPVLYGLYFAINNMLRNTKVVNGQHVVDLHAINAQLYPFVPHFTQPPNVSLDWFTFISPAFHISLLSPAPVLAVLAGIATFIQLRMSQPKPIAGATTPVNDPSAQSMKMMQYVMPVMITIFGWNVAAGLALYWMISSMFQAVQQFFVTGWGALLVTPDFHLSNNEVKGSVVSSNSNSYTGDSRRERSLERKAKEVDVYTSDNENDDGDEANPIAGRPRTDTHGSGTSQYNRRRQRSTSASARRRSSTQRSRS